MTEPKFPPLRYSIARLAAVERYLNRKVADLLEEMRSDTGTSLITLSALIAAGRLSNAEEAGLGVDGMAAMMGSRMWAATTLIEKHGVKTAAAAVGATLGAYLPTVER